MRQQDARERFAAAQKLRREASKSPEALGKHIEPNEGPPKRDSRVARKHLPAWLTDEVYLTKIQSALDGISKLAIADAADGPFGAMPVLRQRRWLHRTVVLAGHTLRIRPRPDSTARMDQIERRGEGIEPSKPGAARPCQF